MSQNQRCLPGVLLICATAISILIANSNLNEIYNTVFHHTNLIANFNLHMIINDFMMAIFFLSVGLEIKKEILEGSLSSIGKASFPVIASLGGVVVPAIIFMIINKNTPYLNGVGVAISTDIAFAVGIFMMFKSRLNSSLKIFLLSLAVVDDLISILVIVFLYSARINLKALIISSIILLVLLGLNKILNIRKVWPYILGGLFLWFFIYKSGIHATISGVLLAAIIPSSKDKNGESMSDILEHKLTKFCNLIILPLFAFANTSIAISFNSNVVDASNLVMGIICGLVIGKPLGVVLFSFVATKLHIAEKPETASWISITEVALLTGIGFTMSIFISELAFAYNENVVNLAKLSILTASVISIIVTQIALSLKYSRLAVKIKSIVRQ
ncbi:Na+/H+ antiporter NhaA [Terrisporobacter sp.]